MKKSLFLFLISFLFLQSLTAQIGVKFGMNQSFITSYGNSEEGESNQFKTGFQAGFIFKQEVSNKISFLAEINYELRSTISKKEYSFEVPTNSTTVNIIQNTDSKLHYINIPILVVFGNRKFNFYSGINMGWLVKATGDYNSRWASTSLIGVTDLKINWLDENSISQLYPFIPDEGDAFAAIDFGLNVGAMFYFKQHLHLDLRINQGLTDITNNAYDFSVGENLGESRKDIDRNFSAQLSLGYFF